MSYEIKGTVKLLDETQTFSSGFSKKEFVVTTDDKYPQDVKFEATKEKIEQVDRLNVGDLVNVSFNIRGNEYKGRYYVNLQAWKVEVLDKAKGGVAETVNRPQEPSSAGGDIEEDVPFAPFEKGVLV